MCLTSSLRPDCVSGVRLALRARFLSIAAWLVVFVVGAALLAAQFSARQPATVGLDVGLSVLRLALPLAIIILVQELFSREFDRRYFLMSLTYPRPRYGFLLGRVAVVATLSAVLLVTVGLLLAGVIWWVGTGYEQSTPVALGAPYWVTLSFLAADLLVVTCVATFLAVVAVTPSFVLVGTLGFAIAARSYSTIVALLRDHPDVVSHADRYGDSVELLGYLLPDLAALDTRMAALYGSWTFVPESWAITLLGSVGYGAGFIGLAIWAIQRKRFS